LYKKSAARRKIMVRRIIIGILLVSVLGAGGTALAYQAITSDAGAVLDVPGASIEEQGHDNSSVAQQIDAGLASEGQEQSHGQGGGQGGGQGKGAGQGGGEPQVSAKEWITYSGELIAYQGNTMTLATSKGELFSFQTGQSRFFAAQGVSFQVGEEISVLGFFEGEQFMAAEITQYTTGLRVMLRDPNGRPLWAGPGNSGGNGKGGGNGNGKGGGGNGNGNGNGGGGNGNGSGAEKNTNSSDGN
jgi:hypothetical protein